MYALQVVPELSRVLSRRSSAYRDEDESGVDPATRRNKLRCCRTHGRSSLSSGTTYLTHA